MKSKHIITLDFVLVVGTLLAIAWVVGYSQPLVIAPLNDHVTTETAILFEFEKADVVYIDDNLEFSSPIEIHAEDNLVITLDPGVYYWKVVGAHASDVRKLTIESSIDLRLKPEGERYSVVNAGNTPLDVAIYERDTLKESVILGVDQIKEVAGDRVIGSEQ